MPRRPSRRTLACASWSYEPASLRCWSESRPKRLARWQAMLHRESLSSALLSDLCWVVAELTDAAAESAGLGSPSSGAKGSLAGWAVRWPPCWRMDECALEVQLRQLRRSSQMGREVHLRTRPLKGEEEGQDRGVSVRWISGKKEGSETYRRKER